MSGNDSVVAVVRRNCDILWFRSERDIWVLDWRKWREDFVAAGFSVPDLDASARFGIDVVNEHSTEKFFREMKQFQISKDDLYAELAARYDSARSWWDVADLFPIVFVDFDHKKLYAFYPDGTKMERYAPDGWESEFADFANCCPEDVFPQKEKFWVRQGVDMLRVLNERGKNLVE